VYVLVWEPARTSVPAATSTAAYPAVETMLPENVLAAVLS